MTYVSEQLEILRRIAETGHKVALSHPPQSEYIDLFQHLLDEIERTRLAFEEGIADKG